jgi:exopolysaccharide biosynthesis polyprenyl glycosylphosphotransferase
MIAARARVVVISYVVSDLLMTSLSLFAAHSIRASFGRDGSALVGPLHPFSQYFPLLGFILPLWALVLTVSGMYGRRSARTLRTEVSRLVRALSVAALLLAFAIFAGLDVGPRRVSGTGIINVSRTVIILFLLLNGPLIAAGRLLVRLFLLDPATRRHLLIAGSRDEVMRTAHTVNAHRDWGLQVAGLVTDGTWGAFGDEPWPVVGAFHDVPALVRRLVVDEVIIVQAAGQLEHIKELESVFLRLEEQGIVTRLLVNFLPRSLSEISLEQFGGMPLLTFSTTPRNELLLFIRRSADVALATALVILFSPVLAAIALAVKITSPGPVLFRQKRCGLNGRPFTFLKFRSMREGADALKPSLAPFNEMDRPAFKMTNDPRVTSVGRFLRRTSLDELPQLLNILRGDMSFVGPRPAVIEEVEQYEPWQRRRLSMKPGLTCLWQVSGRSDLTFDEWMRLDLEYIDNWSLWLDVKIALKTIPAVLLGKGAK